MYYQISDPHTNELLAISQKNSFFFPRYCEELQVGPPVRAFIVFISTETNTYDFFFRSLPRVLYILWWLSAMRCSYALWKKLGTSSLDWSSVMRHTVWKTLLLKQLWWVRSHFLFLISPNRCKKGFALLQWRSCRTSLYGPFLETAKDLEITCKAFPSLLNVCARENTRKVSSRALYAVYTSL